MIATTNDPRLASALDAMADAYDRGEPDDCAEAVQRVLDAWADTGESTPLDMNRAELRGDLDTVGCYDGGSDVGYQRFHASDCVRTDAECRARANRRPDGWENARCESGRTGDRCTYPLFHEGPHSNEGGRS
jgi:hypothetical protein